MFPHLISNIHWISIFRFGKTILGSVNPQILLKTNNNGVRMLILSTTFCDRAETKIFSTFIRTRDAKDLLFCIICVSVRRGLRNSTTIKWNCPLHILYLVQKLYLNFEVPFLLDCVPTTYVSRGLCLKLFLYFITF